MGTASKHEQDGQSPHEASSSRLPSGWRWITVGEAGEVRLGRQRSPKNRSANYPTKYIRAANITWDGLDLSDLLDMEFRPEEQTTYRLRPGDVVLSEASGSADEVGKPALWNGEIENCCFQNTVIRFRPTKADPRFAFIAFQHFARNAVFSRVAKGVGIHHLGADRFSAIPFPLPPLNEQRRIITKIEELFSDLDAAVAALKRTKANLKNYRAAVLKAAVEGKLTAEWRGKHPGACPPPVGTMLSAAPSTGRRRAGRLWGGGFVPELTRSEQDRLPNGWTWTKVQSLGTSPEDTVQVGPMSMRSVDFEPTGVPVLNVGCVQWGNFQESKLDFLPERKAKSFDRYRIRPGDVLFTRSGTVGRCAVAQGHQDGWLMTFHLLRVRPSPACCLSDYLRIVFEGAPHIRRQTKGASIGSTRAGFNTRLLAQLDVPLPSLAEQEQIITYFPRLPI